MRLQADFDNFRKRTAAEKDSLRTQVKGDTVAELLPLVSPDPRQARPEVHRQLPATPTGPRRRPLAA